MADRLKFFLLNGIYWLFFFFVARVLFLVYEYQFSSELSAAELFTPLLLGMRMDAAMMGYWLIITGLLFTFSPWLNNKQLKLTHIMATAIILVACLLIVVSDLELYKHWAFRINSTPLMYLGSEATNSISSYVILTLVTLFIVLAGSFSYLYWKLLFNRFDTFKSISGKWAPVWFLITGLLIIPIRSSFSVAPLNTGAVYFHKTKSFPNHAGINPVWNFLISIIQDNNDLYPSNFYIDPKEDFNKLLSADGDTQKLIKEPNPNVILIILESFTSKIIEPLGGVKGITPNINKLVHEGILFNNFYASGDRTDKGIVSILSGYPAQPKTSIIKFPNKTEHLPHLSKEMKLAGYKTSFLYGGDIDFANMNSYFTQASFDLITAVDDFNTNLDDSKWGVADHFVFNRLLQECDTTTGSFFKVMLTLSSHEPFEVPMDPVIKGNDEQSKFLNACYYTDQSLGKFIDEARQKTWWNNTLIIITADHGHRFPNGEELKDKERFKIPMLWLGGAISHKDTTITKIGSQVDIAKTLLAQLNRNGDYQFSKDLLNDGTQPFAVYIFNNGFGYISNRSESIYDFDLNNYLKISGDSNAVNPGKAYLQKLFDDYNSR